jgi:predicted NBD/HSP70 family sugar kinase
LLELGLITPVSDAESTGGRRSTRVAFNPSARVVIGADVGATHVRIAVCDLAGAVLSEHQDEIPVTDGPERVLSYVIEGGLELLAAAGRPPNDVAAVGIGVPGPVDHATGRPSDPPIMPGWNDYDIPARIQTTFPCPVLVDNDVNIMALGERWMHYPNVPDLTFIKVATGIGAGIISDGNLRRGANGTAGDIGHVQVPRAAGKLCRCGKTGCLEPFAAAPGIIGALREKGLQVADSQDIVRLVRAGNLEAAQQVRESGRAIGEMLNMFISVVNPSVVVIGGMIAQIAEHLIAGIRQEVYTNSAPIATKTLSIVQSLSGPRAAVVGAGLIASEHILDAAYVNALQAQLRDSRD